MAIFVRRISKKTFYLFAGAGVVLASLAIRLIFGGFDSNLTKLESKVKNVLAKPGSGIPSAKAEAGCGSSEGCASSTDGCDGSSSSGGGCGCGDGGDGDGDGA